MSQQTGGDGPSAPEGSRGGLDRETALSAAQLAAVLDASTDCLLVLDKEGRIVHCNALLTTQLAEHAGLLQPGKPFTQLVDELSATGQFYNALPQTMDLLRDGERQRIAVPDESPEGATPQQRKAVRRLALHKAAPCDFEAEDNAGHWLQVATRTMEGGGTVIHYRDITAWKVRALQLEHTALHDPATGLPNRVLFLDRLAQELRSCSRERNRSFGIALIEFEKPRVIDSGIAVDRAEAVLAAVARRIERTIRPADTLAHLEGNRFACIVVGLRDQDEAHEFAHRIQRALADPVKFEGLEIPINAGIGIAFGDRTVTDAEAIMRDAAIALDLAKGERSNNAIAVFDQVMRSTTQTRFQLDIELRQAIRQRTITMHYQPIVEVETLRLVGFEALARWPHPRLKDVPPGVFIRMAEDSGLIAPLGRLALDIAAGDLATWLVHNERLFVTVNISPRQFDEHDLVADLRSTMKRHKLPTDSLHLEITESTMVENPEQVAEAVASIRDLGVLICVDDFGTGYSSLQLLQTMPYDVLKIDRGFVAGMAEGRRNRVIMEMITELAHRMGMRVVAEGIERHDQLAMIRKIGCNFAQGFLFAPPMSAEAALNVVRAGRLDFA
jgi:diguanylate cyclase (GGDEF)-like protein